MSGGQRVDGAADVAAEERHRRPRHDRQDQRQQPARARRRPAAAAAARGRRGARRPAPRRPRAARPAPGRARRRCGRAAAAWPAHRSTASSSAVPASEATRSVRGPPDHLLEHRGEEADAEHGQQPTHGRARGQHQDQVGGDRRGGTDGQRAREPLDAGDQHPGQHQAQLQDDDGGQPAQVAQRARAGRPGARRRPRRSRRRAGGAPGPAARTPGRRNSRVDRRRSPASDPLDERSGRAALGVSEAGDHPRRGRSDPAAWASARKCSSGKYSSRSPCTSSSGVGAIALTTCSGDGGAVSHGSPSRSRTARAPTRRPAVVSSSQCTRRIGRVSRTYQRLTALTLTTASGRCRPSAACRRTAPPPIEKPRVTTASAPSARAAATAASTSRSSGSPPVPEPPPDRP